MVVPAGRCCSSILASALHRSAAYGWKEYLRPTMRRRLGVSEIILLKSIKRTEKSIVNHELVRNNELSVPVMILKKDFCLQNEEKKICGLGWIISIPVIFPKNEGVFLPKKWERKICWFGWIIFDIFFKKKLKGFSWQNMEKRRLVGWGGSGNYLFLSGFSSSRNAPSHQAKNRGHSRSKLRGYQHKCKY